MFDIIDEFSRRYFYAISSDVAIDNPGRIVKVDTQTSKVLSFLCWAAVWMYFPTPLQNAINPGAELEWRQLLLFWARLHLRAWGGLELFRDLVHLFAADRLRRIPACSSAPCCGASQGWTPQLFWSSRLRIFRHLQGLSKLSEGHIGNFSSCICSNTGCHSSYLAQYQNRCTALSCPLGTSKTSKKRT